MSAPSATGAAGGGNGGGRSGGGGRRVGRGRAGGHGGEQAAEVVEVRAFFELEVKVLLGEVEVGEPVLVHEFDDSTDFLEFHGVEKVGSWMNGEASGGTRLVRAS